MPRLTAREILIQLLLGLAIVLGAFGLIVFVALLTGAAQII